MELEAEKISIVIPAYNCEATLARCLDSALAQTYANKEIIVVDDGSQDGTPEIADSYQRAHPEIRVIHKQNGGVSAARNDGMRSAEGAWLVTLDADDYIDAEMLSVMHAAAKRSDAQLCICGFRMVYEDEEHKELRQVSEDFEGNRSELLNTVFLELYDAQLINNQNNKLYRLDLIREHGIFYDTAMQINEDLWFSLEYMRHCSEIAVLKKAFLNYMQHREGESLVSKYHANCVDTCFSVLHACDALFDGCKVSDDVINAVNNRMLFLICGYAGWQYYKTALSDEELLENIRALCGREDFQRLLSQTDPIGLKNRTAHYLLKRKKAEAYHRLCKLLYRNKRKTAQSADENAVQPEAGEACPEAGKSCPEVTVSKEPDAEAAEETPETEVKRADPVLETPIQEAERSEQEAALLEEAASVEEDGQTRLPEDIVPWSSEEPNAEAAEVTPETDAEAAAEEMDADVQTEGLESEDSTEQTEGIEQTEDIEPAEAAGQTAERERAARRAKRRRTARRPRDPEQIEGQIELWDLLRAEGALDGITDEELKRIEKKLEESV